ncbi:GNAT family N-acetyltransferase [Gaoshiqia sediminis]|uniref:GNAT family N-acetyltransferase n=1 Tax=Gaoshiqia sediminis TaxID=2986998 RepID=A0AA41YBI2_9BACT|nr:GNAT family N-acetyltransferase [Gaoshiqia sediminis]MCW0483158.1 GNAT family N-acetyltransferase [Gaoshiqia sediminis]
MKQSKNNPIKFLAKLERKIIKDLEILNNHFHRFTNHIHPIKDRLVIKIKLYEDLNESQRKSVNYTFRKVYQITLEKHHEEWEKPHYLALGYLNNKLIAIRYIVLAEALFDGTPVKLAGTGGLLTLPSYRRLGIAEEIFRRVDDYIFDNLNIDCGLFICGKSLVKYYERLGWTKLTCYKLFYQNNDNKISRLKKYAVMIKSKSRIYNPELIEINGKLW